MPLAVFFTPALRIERILFKLKCMIFRQKWIPTQSRNFNLSWSKLISQFDSSGYELNQIDGPAKSEYEILIPGLDSYIIQSETDSGALSVLRKFTWEKVELKINHATGEVHSKLVYFSPLQIMMHAMITFMVGMEAFSFFSTADSSEPFLKLWAIVGSFIFMSFIPVVLSLREMGKLQKLFEASGFSARRQS